MRLVALQWGNGAQVASVELLDLRELEQLVELTRSVIQEPIAPPHPADPPGEVTLEIVTPPKTSRPRHFPRKAREAPRHAPGRRWSNEVRGAALSRVAKGESAYQVGKSMGLSSSQVAYWVKRAAIAAGPRSASRSSASAPRGGSATAKAPATDSRPVERSPGARSTASRMSSPTHEVESRCFSCGVPASRLIKGRFYCPVHSENAIRNGA